MLPLADRDAATHSADVTAYYLVSPIPKITKELKTLLSKSKGGLQVSRQKGVKEVAAQTKAVFPLAILGWLRLYLAKYGLDKEPKHGWS